MQKKEKQKWNTERRESENEEKRRKTVRTCHYNEFTKLEVFLHDLMEYIYTSAHILRATQMNHTYAV